MDLDLRGFYNDTCNSNSECFPLINLECKEGRCLCIDGYALDHSGVQCHITVHETVLLWSIRLGATAAIFLFCSIILYFIANREFCCRRRENRQNLLDGDEDNDENRACWHEAPPPYVEVVDSPPSYSQATSKNEKWNGFETEGTDRYDCERGDLNVSPNYAQVTNTEDPPTQILVSGLEPQKSDTAGMEFKM